MLEEIKKKAKKAKDKPASFGPDINLKKFSLATKPMEKISKLSELSKERQKDASNIGIDVKEKQRSGSFFQLNHSVIYERTKQEGLEVMSVTEALKKYSWLKDYWWKAVAVDSDKYTAQAELKQTKGYFIRVLPGVKVRLPVQACLFMSQEGLAQNVHNIIIAEEGAELQIITGCAVASHLAKGLHIGVSEFFVKKNATIVFSMIHAWGPEVDVRPRTGAIVGENGTFVNNYICFKPVKSLQMYPTAYCIGKNSKARYHTLLYGTKLSYLDVGSRAVLKTKESRAEITARVVATDGSQIISRGHLVGEHKDVKAHLECRGLLLSEKAKIHAIPELEGKVEGCDLSHEAAVGKIREEELWYLMSRGFTEQEATSMIVRGFLDPEIIGLPPILKMQIKKVVESIIKGF
ncbi:MAG: SufD family Fe-S cluster assembly protein [Candidatus Aenigmarchaeota archaeon]|nr:SufD family Fe-S cluster assembly protein [Candidatus Aenigmarchaeota archaeon]